MTDQVKTASGEVFSFTFTKGLPTTLAGPNLYLLFDGSTSMGELEWIDGKQWLKTFNPAGMTPMEIAANKIIGWTSAGATRIAFD